MTRMRMPAMSAMSGCMEKKKFMGTPGVGRKGGWDDFAVSCLADGAGPVNGVVSGAIWNVNALPTAAHFGYNASWEGISTREVAHVETGAASARRRDEAFGATFSCSAQASPGLGTNEGK